MRIISGSFKGKKILTPIDDKTRPVKDLTKVCSFNIIIHSNNFNDTLNLTFNLTDDMFVKNFFDSWQDAIFPLVEDRTGENKLSNNIKLYPDSYVGDITISKLSKDLRTSYNAQEETYTIKLMEAFPKQLNPISLSYTSNEVMKLQVVIAYSRWQRIYR